MLCIKITIPTSCQARQKKSLLHPVRRDKYGAFKTHSKKEIGQIKCWDPLPVLVKDHPTYYGPPPLSAEEQRKRLEAQKAANKPQSNNLFQPLIDAIESAIINLFRQQNNNNNRQDYYNPFSSVQRPNNPPSSQYNNNNNTNQHPQASDQALGSSNHLDGILENNQNSNYFKLSEPPQTFKSELHDYQKQALTWMLYREGVLENQELYNKLNQDTRQLSDLFQEMQLIDGFKFYFNPFSGLIRLNPPKPKHCRGGILADEMGLGKTVMTIALLHTNRRRIYVNEEDSEDEMDVQTSQEEEEVSSQESEEDEKKEEENNEDEGEDSVDQYIPEEDWKARFAYKPKAKQSEPIKPPKKIMTKKPTGSMKVINTNMKKENKKEKEREKRKERLKTKKLAETLIVVPVTVLTQWEAEIANHSNENTLKVLQYYGTRKGKCLRLQEYDVVLTTYGVLGAEFGKQKPGQPSTGLFAYNWFRVILDEGHYIKGRATRTAKGACALQADNRWCLTGTPLQNRLDDLFSIVKFLRLETWSEYFWWNSYINNYTSDDDAFGLLRSILRPILLRRTKKSTYLDGRCILELPPKEIKTCLVKLTKEERGIYNSMFKSGKSQFDEIVSGGTLQYEYAHVFELLTRLRQICDHPSLVFTKEDLQTKDNLDNAIHKFLEKRATSATVQLNIPGKKATGGPNEAFIQETISNLKNSNLQPCTVCLEDITDPAITSCCHIFCRQCILSVTETLKSCPVCRKAVQPNDIMHISL